VHNIDSSNVSISDEGKFSAERKLLELRGAVKTGQNISTITNLAQELLTSVEEKDYDADEPDSMHPLQKIYQKYLTGFLQLSLIISAVLFAQVWIVWEKVANPFVMDGHLSFSFINSDTVDFVFRSDFGLVEMSAQFLQMYVPPDAALPSHLDETIVSAVRAIFDSFSIYPNEPVQELCVGFSLFQRYCVSKSNESLAISTVEIMNNTLACEFSIFDSNVSSSHCPKGNSINPDWLYFSDGERSWSHLKYCGEFGSPCHHARISQQNNFVASTMVTICLVNVCHAFCHLSHLIVFCFCFDRLFGRQLYPLFQLLLCCLDFLFNV
jgi:hypothetical protein